MLNRLRPRALRRGDTVGIAAPASPVREEFLAAGESRLRGLGFAVRRARHVLARSRYTAGTAAERAADLLDLYADPDVRAIWCARGGYGSPQLPPLLPEGLARRDPKVLIGASDITALLLWSLQSGVPCLHGPMPAQELARDRFDAAELGRLLTERQPAGPLDLGPLRRLHPGSARGPLTGGCLALVVASLGTPWEVDTEGALLFLEDQNTKPYQIDRMLTQLAQAGKLGSAAAILFGQMPGCEQTADQGYHLDEVLADLTAGLGIPVVAGVPGGHTTGVHRALPFGVLAGIDADLGRLSLLEALVE